MGIYPSAVSMKKKRVLFLQIPSRETNIPDSYSGNVNVSV